MREEFVFFSFAFGQGVLTLFYRLLIGGEIRSESTPRTLRKLSEIGGPS
jgi:hypothetical protein